MRSERTESLLNCKSLIYSNITLIQKFALCVIFSRNKIQGLILSHADAIVILLDTYTMSVKLGHTVKEEESLVVLENCKR
jgi:hypothetical protein